MKHFGYAFIIAGLLAAGFALAAAVAEEGASQPAGEEMPAVNPDEIKALVKQLGDEDYQNRRVAYDKLLEIGRPALEELKKAMESEDAEIRASAQQLIDKIGESPETKPDENAPAGDQQQDIEQIRRGVKGFARTVVFEETNDGKKIRYEFTETAGKGLDVVVTETDEKGESKSESKHFESTVDMKEKDNALYEKYVKAQENVRRAVDARGNWGAGRQVIQGSIEMKLQMAEALGRNQKAEELLRELEKEFLQLLKKLDAVERTLANRALRDALDMETWSLPPACSLPGVAVRPVDETLKSHLGLKGGVVVSEVQADSEFAKGLKAHDIITELDGTAVENIEALNKAFETAQANKKCELKIIRNGKEEKTTVEWTE